MLLNPIAGFFAWAVHRKKIHKKTGSPEFYKKYNGILELINTYKRLEVLDLYGKTSSKYFL